MKKNIGTPIWQICTVKLINTYLLMSVIPNLFKGEECNRTIKKVRVVLKKTILL